jgi:Ca2+-binding EF-hand superfamily protein
MKNDRNGVTGGYRPSFTTIGTLCLIIATSVFLFPANRVLARESFINRIFNAADTDGDGLISKQEWHQAMKKRFETLDTSNDRNISREEFEQQEEISGYRLRQAGWSSFVRSGGVKQFDTDISDGSSFETTRLTLQLGGSYARDYRTSVGLTIGYSYNGYSFSTGTAEGVFEPWEDVHNISLGLPVRWGMGKKWSGFLNPTIRATGEQGAAFNDSLTGGVFGGAAYRFSDRLVIGPGIGVISQLEESATVFPILIIDWKITDRLSLETGSGLGATLGPGLVLNYQLNKNLMFSLGGRYEKLRFRLDEDGAVPSGIGEDTSFPVFIGCSYEITPQARLSLVGGIETSGDLRLEEKDGKLIRKESYDSGGFFGLTFNIRI